MNKKKYPLYLDEKKTKIIFITYEQHIQASKYVFLLVLKELDIDNELRPEHRADDASKKTLYEKFLDIHKGIDEASIDTELFEFIESLYIETLRVLDIDDKLTDEQKYVPKKYNDPKMSLTEKIEVKKLIEPNLWNKFDDYSKLAFERYDFDTFNYDFQYQNYLYDFISYFMTHIMFHWGEGIGLPLDLNPIPPALIARKQRIKKKK